MRAASLLGCGSRKACGRSGTHIIAACGLSVVAYATDAGAQAFQFPPPSPGPRPVQAPTAVAPAPAPLQPVAPAPTFETPAAPTQQAPTQPQLFAAPTTSTPTAAAVGPSFTPAAPYPPAPSAVAPASVAAWPPGMLAYRDGMPIPQGYHLESHVNGGLVYGGLALWAAPYVTGLIAAAASGFTKGSGWLALPIAGPFVAIGGRNIDCDPLAVKVDASTEGPTVADTTDQCRKSAIQEIRVVALLTLDGLLQTTGAIMSVAGLLSPNEVLLRNDIFPPETKLSFDASFHQGFRLHARMQF